MILLMAFWFFLPAGVANMGPVFAAKLPGLRHWNTPLDFGRTYRGKRIFGPHKTWRGLVAGIVLATLVLAVQKYLFTYTWAQEISWMNYRADGVWIVGPLLGAGALLGDAIESFFKRQKGVASGEVWFPFDQTDYILGGLLLAAPVVPYSIGLIASIFAIYFGLHVIVAYLGYRIGLKDKPI